MTDLAADLDLAITAAREAGALALKYFQTDVKNWDKAPGDPVSEADLAVNDLIANILQSARPNYGWLSEETQDTRERLSAETIWVVDPIDGTRAFLAGKPEYCISIASVRAGRPQAAALYDPSRDLLYSASAGHGAHCNGKVITASAARDALSCRLLMAKDMLGHRFWPEPWTPQSLMRPNSIALRLAWVASGEHDAMIALSPKQDWDLAAGDLILTEAGGLFTDEHSRPLIYNCETTDHPFVVGCAPGVHKQTCVQVRGMIANFRSAKGKS